jgi:hypothetical protein
MTVPEALPYEYATRVLPEAVELCMRCKGGLVHRRGPDQLAYCVRCGFEGAGVRYIRVDGQAET